jgi:predicted SnoaL-like aldol condensation-catalyzing enzyme
MDAAAGPVKGTRRDAAVSFLRLASAGNVRDAYQRHVAPAFLHHNPYFQGDAASLAAAMEANARANPQRVLEVLRALEDGDFVAVHSRARLKPGGTDIALIHLFRFEGDKIAELWDIGQQVPDPSPNENGMF